MSLEDPTYPLLEIQPLSIVWYSLFVERNRKLNGLIKSISFAHYIINLLTIDVNLLLPGHHTGLEDWGRGIRS